METAGSRTLVIATGNPGKFGEFQSLLAPGGFALLAPRDVGFSGEVEETGRTFAENALLKARALAACTSHPVLADDSGLEVAALEGRPGLYSARFAAPEEVGAASQDAANRAKLLKALAGREDREARFICVLCYLEPGREPAYFEGVCPGEIAREEKGAGGFGYDSLVVPAGFNRTFAEMPEPVKDRLSHRGKAVGLFLEWMKK